MGFNPQHLPCKAALDAQLDQEWAELRQDAMENNPFALMGLFLKIDPDKSLQGLDEEERPFVAHLARMAIKQIFASCHAAADDELANLRGADQ